MSPDKGSPYGRQLDQEIEEIRKVLHDISNQTSIVHANLAFAEDHLPSGASADLREAVQDAGVAAAGMVELVRRLQRLIG